MAAGNLRGNGSQDIAVLCAISKTLEIFDQDLAGRFVKHSTSFSGGWGSVAIADLNGDGKDDLIVANNAGNTVTVTLSH